MHSTKRNAAAEARGVPETDQLGGKVIWENSLASRPVQGRSGGRQLRPGLESRSQMNTARITEPRLLRNGRQRCAAERLEHITPADVFRARCEARALLCAAGELDLLDAVDALQAAAVANGLVVAVGQDAVQAIMAKAFERALR